MKILLTGNQGYIGTVLYQYLTQNGYSVTGYDSGYYKDCNLTIIADPKKQISKDIRDVNENDLEGIDIVVHLAALSNDPLGDFDEKITYQINHLSTSKLADISKKMGLKRFIFVSTQSLYGISNTDDELDEVNSKINPLTAYAKSKYLAEQDLLSMADDNFQVCIFRPSTVFGSSPRLRCDIVYNNLLGSAFTLNKIEIKSDGSPWRPVIHIKDVCQAIHAGIVTNSEKINKKIYNIGIRNGNFTVKDIANAANSILPNSRINYTNEHGSDSRTYKVSFSKIFEELNDYYKPDFDLKSGGRELVDYFIKTNFTRESFEGSNTNRLKKLKELVANNKLDNNLRMI